MKIMIVEDEDIIRNMLTDFFEDRYEVVTHDSYENAQPTPDVNFYILDFNIKGSPITGKKWLEQYQNQIEIEKLVLMSGTDDWNNSGYTAGKLIGKPFTFTGLEKLLQYDVEKQV